MQRFQVKNFFHNFLCERFPIEIAKGVFLMMEVRENISFHIAEFINFASLCAVFWLFVIH